MCGTGIEIKIWDLENHKSIRALKGNSEWGTALEVIGQLNLSEYGTKGEFVLIVSAFEKVLEQDFSLEDKRIMDLLWNSLPQKDALSLGSKILNKKRNFLYQKKIDNK